MAIIRTRAVVDSGAYTGTGTASTTDQLNIGTNVASTSTVTTFLGTQSSADALAAYLAATSATNAPIVRITLDRESTLRASQLRDVELNARIIATEAVTGGTLDGFVEQITHRITNGGLKHECELVIGARTRMVGIYSPSAGTTYSLSTYAAASPTEPPPYATYGF